MASTAAGTSTTAASAAKSDAIRIAGRRAIGDGRVRREGVPGPEDHATEADQRREDAEDASPLRATQWLAQVARPVAEIGRERPGAFGQPGQVAEAGDEQEQHRRGREQQREHHDARDPFVGRGRWSVGQPHQPGDGDRGGRADREEGETPEHTRRDVEHAAQGGRGPLGPRRRPRRVHLGSSTHRARAPNGASAYQGTPAADARNLISGEIRSFR